MQRKKAKGSVTPTPKKVAKQSAATAFPAPGRWPTAAWKELAAIQSRLKRDELTADDKTKLTRILQAMVFDQDPRAEYWEQIDPRHLVTSEAQLRISILNYLLSQHVHLLGRKPLEDWLTERIAVAVAMSKETVRRAVKVWKTKPEQLALYARMKYENDPSYTQQRRQLGLTDADIEKLATKLRGS